MIQLKKYQEKVVDEITSFFVDLNTEKEKINRSEEGCYFWNYLGNHYSNHQWQDQPMTGSERKKKGNKRYPRVCVKIPTGGGKTLIGIESIKAYQNILAPKRTGLIVWMVHRESIYTQTLERLKNKWDPYRQILDGITGNRVLIKNKEDSICQSDVENNLVVMMLMIQKLNSTSFRKIFEDGSADSDFFPSENNIGAQQELLKEFRNLDLIEGSEQIKHSLGNMIRVQKPYVIVDEFHRMFTDKSKEVLNDLNPSCLIGLSATPKKGMNIISEITGRELDDEEMVKFPIRVNSASNHWKSMIASIISKREELEEKAIIYQKNGGEYIRPIALIQVERTGKDQRGKGYIHSDDVREYLENQGIPSGQIAEKSSQKNEIKNKSLLSKNSNIRYLITKEALKEGWDCSFAYILGIIPNAKSDTGITQLVGRILRQPNQKKTKISELNSSYVYFNEGRSEEMINQIIKGLQKEGLSDLSENGGVQDENNQQPFKEEVSIKSKIFKKFENSLFLPTWVVKDKENYRKFSYSVDIKPKINWDDFEIKRAIQELYLKDISNKKTETIIHANLESKVGKSVESKYSPFSIFDLTTYLCQINQIITNPFIAYKIAENIHKQILKKYSHNLLDKNFNYIKKELCNKLKKFKQQEEEKIFNSLVKNQTLLLSVSNNRSLGYQIPETDVVYHGKKISKSLYEKVDLDSLNNLELNITEHIEDHKKHILWWTRNKDKKGWYSIQGWQKKNIYPDFIVAKKKSKKRVDFIYIFESKGEHLIGNADTEYKNTVLKRLNEQRIEFIGFNLNHKFDFELIKQGDEETRIREKLGDRIL
ncbi:MAG: DEAD/DEAH box helicase family protein [Flavobacteriaceae bacterium]|nr:DEAD/DEAH box helicase family protein [Flavobacteriaceae bacterium]MCY4267404.1 DEAD/DEAH box helicase family protein [Flavobacteriaceae bacterium]